MAQPILVFFCNSGSVSGFGNNFIRPCAAGFDNTSDYTDLWYQVDLPDGTDEMTLQVNGLGAGEYVGYTLHTAGPLSSSSDFGVNATNNMHCSFFSQTVTEHTITGLASYSTAPIYIRVLAVDPDQNAPCNSYTYPSFTICASAPQPNDECNTSLDITTNNGGAVQSGDLSAASDEGIACLDGVSGADLWYSISSILSSDPNYNGPYQIQVKADGTAGEQMIVQLINGCYSCPTISVLAADTLTFASPDSTDFGGYILSGGISNYYVRVVEYGSTSTFSIEGKLKVANDECVYFNQFTTNFRLWDGTNPVVQLVDMDFSTDGELYYQFSSLLSAPSYSGSADFTIAGLTTNESVQLEVYERNPLYNTDCEALQLVGTPLVISTDGTYTYDCLNQFEGNYLVRVTNVGTSSARFDLSAQPSDVAPLNDQCSTIWDGSSVTFEGAAYDILSAPVVADFTAARECVLLDSDCGG